MLRRGFELAITDIYNVVCYWVRMYLHDGLLDILVRDGH